VRGRPGAFIIQNLFYQKQKTENRKPSFTPALPPQNLTGLFMHNAINNSAFLNHIETSAKISVAAPINQNVP
jgi:hypothetical protein